MSDSPSPRAAVDCWVYRSEKTEEMYLYLAVEDNFDCLPEVLRTKAGKLTRVMQLSLTADRKLARVKVEEVISALKTQGFFLQLPPNLRPHLHFGD